MSAHPSEAKTRSHWPAIIACSVIVVLIAAFVLQNTRSGTIRFLAWETDSAPAWAWLVGVLACGLLTGWLLHSLPRARSGPQ
jgi:uncharacterized integral membrane protein